MKRLLFFGVACITIQLYADEMYQIYPANLSKEINPDTHLIITFDEIPTLNNTGKIKIFRSSDNRIIDSLDLSIPAGPTKAVDHSNNVPPYFGSPYGYSNTDFNNQNTKPGTASGLAKTNSDTFQLNIIGRFTDAFHFYPVIIHDKTATIFLHNNLLNYNEKYYITVDSTVFSTRNNSFKGIYGKSWTFGTKKTPPSKYQGLITVDGNGKGDFNTVQGAIDFIPDSAKTTFTIFIKKGVYEEIVYFRNKQNVTFMGENRDSTIVKYANNEVFNPHPSNISTNEWPGTFPSRRAAFACDNSSNMHFENFTIATTAKGQAEGMLIMGEKNSLKNMHIIGSGDAIQINGSAYLEDCTIDGDGDTYLGRGPVYFNHCRINSYGTFMWVRNTNTNHGVIMKNCELVCTATNGETEIARAPVNKGHDYPYCEAVLLNCKLSGISSIGWGSLGTNTKNIHYWEYNSTSFESGQKIDFSKRHSASKQLTMEKDSVIIKNYSNPAFVLNGWSPDPNVFFEKKLFINQNNDTLRYLMSDNSKGSKKVPLIIYLHGAGENGRDNRKQLTHSPEIITDSIFRDKYPFYFIAPQCPPGKSWVNGRIFSGKYLMKKNEASQQRYLMQCIDSLLNTGRIDENRIYITGASNGGCGTWELLIRHPEKFAAGIVVCGIGDRKRVKTIKNKPVWVFHGEKDNRFNVNFARDMIKSLTKAGGNPKFTEYHNLSHGIMLLAYSQNDLWSWLFLQNNKD
jgi:pectinesterase